MKIFLGLLNIVLFFALITGLFFGTRYIYRRMHYTHIYAIFDEAEPFSPRMRVFYKGFRIGKVTKVEPNKDYTATKMHIVLFPKGVKIPNNVTVKIRAYKDSYNYVDIVSPELASTDYLENDDEVKGSIAQNVNTFFNKHIDDGTLEILVQSVLTILDGVNKTVNDTNALIVDMRNTFNAASPNLIESSRNISTISTNFSGTSLKISNTVNQDSLDRTMKNLERSSENLECLTQKVNCAVQDLPETMERVNSITKDVNEITSGVNNTLKKPMGGARLLMGKPVQTCPCKK